MTSAALKKSVLTQLAILGGISIGGTINPIEELANVLQVAHDAGANKILLPSNAKMICTSVKLTWLMRYL